jgi:citrate lyase beta subunit
MPGWPHDRIPRATLVVPADRAKLLDKAATLKVDGVLLDLEDAISPDSKESARDGLHAALARFRGRHVGVRVNALDTRWGEGDLQAIASLETRPAVVVIPKAEDAVTIQECDRILNPAGGTVISLHAFIETALGLARLMEITRATRSLSALVLGYADLAASLGRPKAAIARPELWAAIQDAVVVAGRASGLSLIDGPLLDIDDGRALDCACAAARMRGFDGKWAIHPSQVAPITHWFTPGPAEVEDARAVLGALQEAGVRGNGSVRLGSAMIDEAVRKSALTTLARAGEAT